MKNGIDLAPLARQLEGELHDDELYGMLYATDASVYRQRPLAVALPRTVADIRNIIDFCRQHGLSLIPRTAGTSLAGQVVGEGIVVDVSKYFNRILEVDPAGGWVRVQPGVIRDELNTFLKPYGLFFGPNTSTANRCMLGGMVGNNSCGTTSIVYGSTRDHVLELRTLLSDGSEATFGALRPEEFHARREQDNLEGQLYRQIYSALNDEERRARIAAEYPKPTIHRRNTGYAIDLLLGHNVFTADGSDFNFCTLLTGSEGTLAFTTEIKLHVDPLPPTEVVVVCAHFSSMRETMAAVLTIMRHQPYACELMDKVILDLTKGNIEQRKNRFFVEGDPAAVLMIELRGADRSSIDAQAARLVADLQAAGQGYAYPLVYGENTQRVWALRAAGLGVLSNMEGEKRAVACIEDTAVAIEDLPAYIDEFDRMMEGFGQQAIYYAHAGAGEIHLRPVLNLKDPTDRQRFHDISERVAHLVKKYRGSLSGEHGDGRVRAEFIPHMIGADNYELLRQIKATWDPHGIFNPGKIVDAPPMNEDLRYASGQVDPVYETAFDYSEVGGLLALAEKCNGSGDCRKLNFSGGVMCPSYRATRDEKDTTRGRANALREILTLNVHEDPFRHPALAAAMDLCLSCKGCTAECPSNVDVATLKAEYQYQRHRSEGIPWRSRAFAEVGRLNSIGSNFSGLANSLLRRSGWLKRRLGIAPERALPALSPESLRRWWQRTGKHLPVKGPERGRVLLFCDEFTNYNDAHIGQAAVRLLLQLGYAVELPLAAESGRAHISKGLLDEAREMARQNVSIFHPRVSVDVPLIGLEPSAVLGFRDEYPRLLRGDEQRAARELAPHVLLFEEFITREAQQGRILPEQFRDAPQAILLHGHCHQKALSSVEVSAFALGIPSGTTVNTIPSGCCGMAGSFGYEAEHYAISMQIGEQVLFPAVRQAKSTTWIAAPGTSCRHQISDGTGRKAQHPAEILWALATKEKH